MESTNGAIKVGVEHRKQGVLGIKLSISSFLRVRKHKMHYNNENRFGIFFIYHIKVCLMTVSTPICNVQRHRCDLFGACVFNIKYGSATVTLTQW
jgi:hypothetical protein